MSAYPGRPLRWAIRRLDHILPFAEKDLIMWSPVTRDHVRQGGMSISALCAAMITASDNTAANVILQTVDGPPGLTRYVRALGDPSTRLDRIEPELNTAIPGDERDTTTPASMLGDMHAILVGNALSPESRALLQSWMIANTTGEARLRAGMPKSWKIGDKTGTGDHGAANDLAIAWPPGRPPVLMAVSSVESTGPRDASEAAIAEVGRVIAGIFSGDAGTRAAVHVR